MLEPRVENALLSRRGALKVGLCASALLATAGLGASLTGCSARDNARGFAVLRSSDLAFLRKPYTREALGRAIRETIDRASALAAKPKPRRTARKRVTK